MWQLLMMFGKAGTKLVATFFLVIILMILGFAFAPGAVTGLQDFANMIEGQVRNPGLDNQGTMLFRMLVNENTIFGIFMTLIARALVEFAAWAGGSGWKAMNGGGAPREDGQPVNAKVAAARRARP